MDILIPDNWLREYLKTEASAKEIGKYLSLCGPSVEKVTKSENGFVYSIEVTTNRIDSVGVYGIAREASAILPTFNIPAKLNPINIKSKQKMLSKVPYLNVEVDSSLCPRFCAILIKNTKVGPSPLEIRQKLTDAGVRPINNIVDVSNYIMHELGQPVHTFDYDKIKNHKMILRASRKGEEITTLDNMTYELPGGDIVIEDGSRQLIDLPGIMGGLNSMIDQNTKNVLLFVQTYNPKHIRQTSMKLAKRSEASSLFEKGLDPELVELGIRRGIDLITELTRGKPEDQILDLYPNPYKTKKIKITEKFINDRLGIDIKTNKIKNILLSLGFGVSTSKDNIAVSVPSFRSQDINIGEDIVEEIARMYGYFNIPSQLMKGELPNTNFDTPFTFERKIKDTLKGLGGVEIYTLSLVSQTDAGNGALKLKNPLGTETEYLRTSLLPSLVNAVKSNLGNKQPFHLYEIANVYPTRKADLPEERTTLAGIFFDYEYRKAKGIVEKLLTELNIDYAIQIEDNPEFLPNGRIVIKNGNNKIGELGILDTGHIYYEFPINNLIKVTLPDRNIKPIPKYPPQIEDLTFTFPPKTKIGKVLSEITRNSPLVTATLTTIYKDSYTFRVWYQHPDKTLTDREVEEIRKNILKKLSMKFGARLKN
ncbi:MAG: phenylalanine--tRNA ligase subunit beta [bacterium]|nr:phenylalanine--tRNA ligase subunit beta [bacterium]